MAIINYQTPRKPFSVPPWVIRWLPRVMVMFIVVAVLLMYFLTEVIPPDILTCNRVSLTEERIREYAARHDRLPAKLSDLPLLPANRDSSTKDAWGRPLIYQPRPDGSVVLGNRWTNGTTCAVTVHFVPTTPLYPEDVMLAAHLIRDYAAANHHLPKRLSDLHNLSGYQPGCINNARGKPLLYQPQPDGSVILASRGKDGSGEAVTVHFTVRK